MAITRLDLFTQLDKLFLDFSWQTHQEYMEIMQPFALTLSQFVVIALLDLMKNKMSLREISDETAIPPSTMTHTIDRLVERGLVSRESHPTDRRTILASLTDAGRSMVCTINQARLDHFQGSWGNLSTEDLSAIARIMNKLNAYQSESSDSGRLAAAGD